jgi:hypothetical protein
MLALVFPMDVAWWFGYKPSRASVHLEKSLGNGDEVKSESRLGSFEQGCGRPKTRTIDGRGGGRILFRSASIERHPTI